MVMKNNRDEVAVLWDHMGANQRFEDLMGVRVHHLEQKLASLASRLDVQDQVIGVLKIDGLAGQAEFNHFIDSHWGPLWAVVQLLMARGDHSACISVRSPDVGSQLSAAVATVNFGSGQASPCPSLLPASSASSNSSPSSYSSAREYWSPPIAEEYLEGTAFQGAEMSSPGSQDASSDAFEDSGSRGLRGVGGSCGSGGTWTLVRGVESRDDA
jgi:hypothetical protein